MRVALLTNLTARASLPVLVRLVDSQRLELQHVFFYNTLAAARGAPLDLLRQFGLKRAAVKAMQVVGGKLRCRLGRLAGPHWFPPRSAHEFAVVQRLPCSLTDDMNSQQSQAQLTALDVDVLIVCVCKNILRPSLLAVPGVEFVNIHPSLLPDFRGPTPTFWMLYHGAQQTGFTVHRMTPQIDRGQILAQRSLPLDRQQTELQIELSVFAAAAEALEEALLRLPELAPTSITPPHQPSGSYHTYPTPAQRRELQRRLAGRRL